MKHAYRSGFRARAVKPDVAASELERIKATEGALTAEAVFEAAKPKAAPLHDEFVWDGKEAVRELGLIRARQIIRSVVVIPEESSEPPRPVYVFVPDAAKPHGPGVYERPEVIVQHVDLYERALSNLQRHFDAAAEALNDLRRVADGRQDQDRLAAIGLAVQGFGAVREALAILK